VRAAIETLSRHRLFAADVDHALKQFTFECLKLVSTDEHGRVEEHVLRHLSEATKQCVPWDYPYPFYKGMLPAASGSSAAAASSDDRAAGRRLLTADALLAAAAAVAPARGDGFDDDAQGRRETAQLFFVRLCIRTSPLVRRDR